MFKKVLIAALAVVVGLAVVSQTKIGSHFRLWLKNGRGWMARQVTPETEIKRLRMEVERLEKEDGAYFDKVARQRLEVKERESKLTKDQTDLATLKTRISDLRVVFQEAKKNDLKFVSYKDLSEVALTDVEKQIGMDFERYKPLKASVESQASFLTSLKTSLAQNEEKLFGLQKTRQEMLTQLQNLENELAELKQAKSCQACVLDDSNYGKVQKDIEALKQRLALEKVKLSLKGSMGKGPIEQAEDARTKKVQQEKDLDAEFPTTKKPLASK